MRSRLIAAGARPGVRPVRPGGGLRGSDNNDSGPDRPAARSPAPGPPSRSPSTTSGPAASRTRPARPSTTTRSARAAESPSSRPNTVDFGATDSAMTDEEVPGREEEGRAGARPDRVRRDHGLLQRVGRREGPEARRPDDRRHLPREDQEVERPRDQAAEPGRRPARARTSRSCTAPTSRARRSCSRPSSRPTAPSGRTVPGVDKTVKWPTGTGAKGNAGVAGGVKQTDGAVGYVEQAYALQNNFTTADVKNKSGKFVAPSLDVDVGRRRGREDPGGPAVQRDQLAQSGGVPDRIGDVPARLRGHVQGRQERGHGPARQELAGLRAGRRPEVAPDLQYAPLPATSTARRRPRSTA